jgi:hypothetical protein
MTPQKTIAVTDDVFEQIKERTEAEGKTVEEAANDAVRLGLSEERWQKLAKRGRNYSREMAEAATGEEAIQIAVEAVHDTRVDVRCGRRTGSPQVPTSTSRPSSGEENGSNCSRRPVQVSASSPLPKTSSTTSCGCSARSSELLRRPCGRSVWRL